MPIILTEKIVDDIFENADDQADAWLGLYKFVFPNWDEIKMLDGYPKVNEKTNKFLFMKFIAFDKNHHPDVIAGGLWMNRGFSTRETYTLPDWEVIPCEYEKV